MSANVCPVCGDGVEIFQKTGMWKSLLTAALYDISLQMNATLELLPVFGAVNLAKNDDGEWDDYITPLLDGSVIFAAMVRPARDTYEVIQITRPTLFDSVTFVYALPEPIIFNPLIRLVLPFQLSVWSAVISSVIATFLILKAILYCRKKRFYESKILKLRIVNSLKMQIALDAKHQIDPVFRVESIAILGVVVKPILDIASIESKLLAKCLSGNLSRCMISLWLLLLISLGCGYKSKLVEIIALPNYNSPPTTFKELAESDFTIGCVMYTGQIEDDFIAKNSSISNALLPRIQEQEFLSPDCYKNVFQPKTVCMGFKFVFAGIGYYHMVDVHKRLMFAQSPETWFFSYTAMGISQHYPELNAPMDQVLQSYENGGLAVKWKNFATQIYLKKGQKNAIEHSKVNKRYLGVVNIDDDSFPVLLMQVLLIGKIISFSLFVLEFINYWRNKRSVQENLISDHLISRRIAVR
ncbi:unnamed protein product [Allacma fusca]|uniref:Ionotropic glutamate receptor C-terminal domain-containing protein n=1 Tax=Allacma fusca TaxID=39272 RepID=A0A8J2L330_9HEXA|nr:unnamed protein product [Allacma fusca]